MMLCAACLAACSSSNETPSDSTGVTETVAPPAVTASAAPSLGLGEPIDLSCRDSASAVTPPADSDLKVAGLAFSGVSATDGTSAGDMELVKDGRTFTFRKVFVYATPQASTKTTLTILGPDTAAFFYQPQYSKSGAVLDVSAAERIDASTRQVSLEGCGKATTGYLGGIIVSRPTCVEIAIAGNGPNDTSTTVVLPVLIDAC